MAVWRRPGSLAPDCFLPGRATPARSRAGGFWRDRRGATAIEYAMIGGLIFAVVAGGIRLYGTRVGAVYERIGTTISQAN